MIKAIPCKFYRVREVSKKEWEALRNHWVWYDRWESESTILDLHQDKDWEWIEMTEITGFPYNIWVAYHDGVLTLHEDLYEWLVDSEEDHVEFENAPTIVTDLIAKIVG